MSNEPIITPGGSPPGTYSRDAIERRNEPAEPDVQAEALEAAADALDIERHVHMGDIDVSTWLRNRAAAFRRGDTP